MCLREGVNDLGVRESCSIVQEPRVQRVQPPLGEGGRTRDNLDI
jgi:hypothetical protein